MSRHPSKDIIGTRGNQLKNRTIVLCITGSVAAVECPRIARSLMRNGAEVFAVMSPMAQKIIHPDLMEWATGNKVVTELTGSIEHVALAGIHPKKADLVLIAPATANTISKIASGIDDTTVTSVVSTAFGSGIPIIIVPAMHESMYSHPVLKENIKKLSTLGIQFVGPRIAEGKAKIARTAEISQAIISKLSLELDLSGLKILVTAGPTVEYIDPIRVLTNKSSGKMGIAIAEEAQARGAKVTLVYGPGKADPPLKTRVIRVETTSQMHKAVVAELKTQKYAMVIAAAAAADWTPEKPSPYKISTHKLDALNLKLKPTEKIIDAVKKTSPKTFMIAFRAEHELSQKQLIRSAHERLAGARADLIVANDIGKEGAGFGTDTNEVFIVDREKKVIHVALTHKREVARRILDVAKDKIKPK